MLPEMRPVRLFGIALIAFALLGLLFFGEQWLSPESWRDIRGPNGPSRHAVAFILIVSLFYVAVGIGALTNARWGYVLLKIFLYLNLSAFPIGTLIGWGMLRYLRRHDIRRHFGFGPRLAADG